MKTRAILLKTAATLLSHFNTSHSVVAEQDFLKANQAYLESSRGKGRGVTMQKEVALAKRHTNPRYPKPHQSARECNRR